MAAFQNGLRFSRLVLVGRWPASSFVVACLVMLGVSWGGVGCKSQTSASTEPVQVTAEERQAVISAFDDLLRSIETCDLPAFKKLHTQKIQGAFDSLAKELDPTTLGPDVQAKNPKDNAALWLCTLAQMAGFVPGQVETVAVAVNPRNGTAKLFFKAYGSEFGFPMARQFGAWKSPYPGYVFLINEYRSWQDAALSKLPEGPARDDLVKQIGRVVRLLNPFQPDWTEFPEMDSGED